MNPRKKLFFLFPVLLLFPFIFFGVFLFFQEGHVAGTFKKQAKVRPTMSLSLGKETVSGEEKIKIYGTISPVKAGVRITLSKRVGKKKKYRTFASVRTDANGEYYKHITPDSNIKAIQTKAKVSKKKLARRSNFDLDSIPDLDEEEADDSGSTSLPACGTQTEFFSVFPVGFSYIAAANPLGNINPTGHIFPSDHGGIEIVKVEPGNPLSPPVETALYAPGNVRVTSLEVLEHLSASPPFSDYTIIFYPCDKISYKFGHVTSLSSKLLSALTPLYENERTYETGGETYHAFNKTVSIDLVAGEQMGTVGGRLGQNGVDFFAYDEQNVNLNFANPSRWYDTTKHAACAFDYFSASLREQIRPKFGSSYQQRTIEPVCGSVNLDIPGTVKGAWFAPGTPNHPEDPHLGLVEDHIDPTIKIFSMGTSMSAKGINSGEYNIPTPQSSGSVNLDFQYVNVAKGIVCYEPWTFIRVADTIFLLQLISDTTLRLEKQTASECGSGPWSFGSNYMDFER